MLYSTDMVGFVQTCIEETTLECLELGSPVAPGQSCTLKVSSSYAGDAAAVSALCSPGAESTCWGDGQEAEAGCIWWIRFVPSVVGGQRTCTMEEIYHVKHLGCQMKSIFICKQTKNAFLIINI